MNVTSVSLKSYLLGYGLSILLTLAAYFTISNALFTGWLTAATVILLALIQALIQLVLFLHLGREDKPRWHLATFLFMLSVLVILFFGSIWIMQSLNYRDRGVSQTER